MTSSKLMAKLSSMPEAMAGASRGSVMSKNTRASLAPRSRAASGRLLSMPHQARFHQHVDIGNAEGSVGDDERCHAEGQAQQREKRQNTMPRMISGVIMGSMEIYSTTFLVRACILVKPTAPRVPMTAAASGAGQPQHDAVAPAPQTWPCRGTASHTSCREKPLHMVEMRFSLNE